MASPYPAQAAAAASAGRELARDWPGWQIDFCGTVVVAYRQSSDGRSRRIVARPTAAELLVRLHEIGPPD